MDAVGPWIGYAMFVLFPSFITVLTARWAVWRWTGPYKRNKQELGDTKYKADE